MAANPKPRTSRERTRAYRERLRAKGLKPTTLWLPDLNDPAVRARLQQEWRMICSSPEEREVMEFLDDVRAWPEGDTDVPAYYGRPSPKP
jgi:hypothetical protein